MSPLRADRRGDILDEGVQRTQIGGAPGHPDRRLNPNVRFRDCSPFKTVQDSPTSYDSVSSSVRPPFPVPPFVIPLTPSPPSPLPPRHDVVIHAEDVVWIVNRLDSRKPLVMRAVRFLHPVGFGLVQVVDVDALAERLQFVGE